MELAVSRQMDENSYNTLKRKLMRNCKYPVFSVIIIWCPSSQVDPGYISTLLGSFDSKVVINNHWVSSSSSSYLKVWNGALAEYESEEVSMLAADSIKKKCGSLKVLLFNEIIDILLQAEFLHPKPSRETTKIVLKAQKPFQKHHRPELYDELSQFGHPKTIYLYRTRKVGGIAAEVEYASQFLAYASKIAMEGVLYKGVGCLSVEIVVTETGKDFDKFVRNRFRSIADDY